MYTFGFSFKHWRGSSSIAKKSKILDYLNGTVKQFGIERRIDYGVNVEHASWSSDLKSWSVVAADGREYRCQYLFMCSGYYDYDKAYEPKFDAIEQFEGDVLHPQFWPADYDYDAKKVVVIGSGATAITLVPSMAKRAKHVTMLQRSPTYIGVKPAIDPIANRLASLFGRWAARWWFILSTMFLFSFCKLLPHKAKQMMSKDIESILGDKFDAKHFTPS